MPTPNSSRRPPGATARQALAGVDGFMHVDEAGELQPAGAGDGDRRGQRPHAHAVQSPISTMSATAPMVQKLLRWAAAPNTAPMAKAIQAMVGILGARALVHGGGRA